jgi:hypothetical protein
VDHLRALALAPGVAPALELISELRRTRGLEPRDTYRLRFYGGVLASHGDLETFDEVLALRLGDVDLDDLFASWAQELVLRGVNVGGPRVDRLVEILVARGHRLASLPMYLLENESGLIAPHYSPTSYDFWSHAQPPGTSIPARTPVPSFVETTTAADDRIAATFESHRTVSNGRSEHRVFALDPPLPHAADPALLAALPLECLEGGFVGETRVEELTLEEAFGYMFAQAAQGGAYSTGSGAYGRRDAWRSLGGLARAPIDASVHEILAIATTVRWTFFKSETPWFNQIMNDLGLAATSQTGETIAILAGTDTD